MWSAVVSGRPSALAAAWQSSTVLIEPAPLASQPAPDVKLVTDPYGSAGVGGGGETGGSASTHSCAA